MNNICRFYRFTKKTFFGTDQDRLGIGPSFKYLIVMPDHGRNISFPDIAAFENQQANRTAIGPQLPTMSY